MAETTVVGKLFTRGLKGLPKVDSRRSPVSYKAYSLSTSLCRKSRHTTANSLQMKFGFQLHLRKATSPKGGDLGYNKTQKHRSFYPAHKTKPSRKLPWRQKNCATLGALPCSTLITGMRANPMVRSTAQASLASLGKPPAPHRKDGSSESAYAAADAYVDWCTGACIDTCTFWPFTRSRSAHVALTSS